MWNRSTHLYYLSPSFMRVQMRPNGWIGKGIYGSASKPTLKGGQLHLQLVEASTTSSWVYSDKLTKTT